MKVKSEEEIEKEIIDLILKNLNVKGNVTDLKIYSGSKEIF